MKRYYSMIMLGIGAMFVLGGCKVYDNTHLSYTSSNTFNVKKTYITMQINNCTKTDDDNNPTNMPSHGLMQAKSKISFMFSTSKYVSCEKVGTLKAYANFIVPAYSTQSAGASFQGHDILFYQDKKHKSLYLRFSPRVVQNIQAEYNDFLSSNSAPDLFFSYTLSNQSGKSLKIKMYQGFIISGNNSFAGNNGKISDNLLKYPVINYKNSKIVNDGESIKILLSNASVFQLFKTGKTLFFKYS